MKSKRVFVQNPGPSCSKLTSSLRVISLTVLADSIYNMLKFFAEKNVSSFCSVQKLLTFYQQKISEYCILNPLKQLTK